ncbi:uncharacterized protein PV07_11763 [Cladophialophora immunda]|uniref:Uncharacterized protein n=1 Tax=Cladophialophora immunda TaxID=569365 RepID=A0A0D2BZ42_9EURO|nr:uncharacterized protein PV07_11763 [Cladophialophora immunda]KIW23575.1 hypothetical protein PV07_11763 [Cladophialophora immunda]
MPGLGTFACAFKVVEDRSWGWFDVLFFPASWGLKAISSRSGNVFIVVGGMQLLRTGPGVYRDARELCCWRLDTRGYIVVGRLAGVSGEGPAVINGVERGREL